jgi:hypothetical protein
MSESLWTTEAPTKPGLYWYCTGEGTPPRQHRVWFSRACGGLYCDFIGRNLQNEFSCHYSEVLPLPTTGYWQPVTIPDPYVAPKPPELKADEVWEARMKVDNEHRWIFRVGRAYFPRDDHGGQCNGDRPHSKQEIDTLYTLIRRVS